MKKIFLIVLTSSILAIAANRTTHAQVVDTVVADVPFGFTVRDTTLPAGEYIIKRVNNSLPGIMEITSRDGRAKALFLVETAELNKEPHSTELIFDRVGDQYFLSEVFEAWDNIGVELPKSRTERRLEKQGATTEVHAVVVPARP